MKRHKGNSFTVTVVRGICDDTTSVYINIFQYPSCQQLLIGPILNRLCHLPLVQSIWCSFSGFLSLHCGGRNHFVQSFHIWISRQEKTEGNMSNEHYTKLSGGLFNSGNSWRWEKRGKKKKETTGTDNETDTSDLSGSLRGWCSRMSYEANALLRQ